MKSKAIRIDAVPFRPALRRGAPAVALVLVALALLATLLAGTAG